MGVFEYITVLVSVILGLGITHLAIGTSKLIQHREEVRLYVPHTMWAVNVLLYILMIWWGMYHWNQHEDWYAYEYLFITLYAIVLFFLASMLYPWDMEKDIDLDAYFYRNRRWFFGTLFIGWLIDIPETVLKAGTGLRDLPQDYAVFVTIELAMAAVGFFTRHRMVHFLLPFVWFAFTVYFAFASIIGRIDA